ncbi:hypothetical protein J5X98_02870 [Leptothermofonsia sichuanensis E412]|uniref:hypothetical protein n=1 Tax=Leptothermofonsia sichuanensis TaxID=2917832 RepID=UPI001CA63024|nr:hypothetical protein [Leptothermofonsia sichuanensis]QZZ21429.1 hypothetical protein J5X98_02870 [Leptothermofonsia sichuanensis E412]
MKPDQDPSSFSSLQQLIEELEKLIAREFNRSGNPWISITKLTELFYKTYEVSPEEVAKVQGYSRNLRSLFMSSGRFSIYGTQVRQEFYVALFQTVFPDFHQPQGTPIKYRIKRPWKVDGGLLRLLKAEGAEEISPPSTQSILRYQPALVPEIKSVNDLKIALIEIIKSLTVNHPPKKVTIGELSKNFSNYYKQPIRTVIRSVCPDMKLIELLQTIPGLHIQKLEHDGQITVEIHSVE